MVSSVHRCVVISHVGRCCVWVEIHPPVLSSSRILYLLELELFLRPTVSRPVSLGIGPPFGTLDQILSCSSSFIWQLRYSAFNVSSLTRKQFCSLQCNHSLVRAVTPSNYTLPSHLRLCSLFIASYDSQGLRWKYHKLICICKIWDDIV
jgi:hypothetical protein